MSPNSSRFFGNWECAPVPIGFLLPDCASCRASGNSQCWFRRPCSMQSRGRRPYPSNPKSGCGWHRGRADAEGALARCCLGDAHGRSRRQHRLHLGGAQIIGETFHVDLSAHNRRFCRAFRTADQRARNQCFRYD